jgi:hypothetical protein
VHTLVLRKRLRLRPLEAYGLEALHERVYPSKFDTAELVAGCGSLFLK